jgi:uncharacterized protein (UPF0218 family)
MREVLQEPYGESLDVMALRSIDQASLVTVGDVVSLTAREEGLQPRICVYDGMTERREMTGFARKVQESGEPIQTVRNPAGTISQELLEALRNAFQTKGRTIIRVDGEEDLAVLACLFLAPEGIKVVYGWPGRGMLLVTTTTATRSMAEALWKELEELE